jgi:hypothetical protein
MVLGQVMPTVPILMLATAAVGLIALAIALGCVVSFVLFLSRDKGRKTPGRADELNRRNGTPGVATRLACPARRCRTTGRVLGRRGPMVVRELGIQ